MFVGMDQRVVVVFVRVRLRRGRRPTRVSCRWCWSWTCTCSCSVGRWVCRWECRSRRSRTTPDGHQRRRRASCRTENDVPEEHDRDEHARERSGREHRGFARRTQSTQRVGVEENARAVADRAQRERGQEQPGAGRCCTAEERDDEVERSCDTHLDPDDGAWISERQRLGQVVVERPRCARGGDERHTPGGAAEVAVREREDAWHRRRSTATRRWRARPRYSPNTSTAMSTVNGPSRFNNNDPLIADTSTRPISNSTGRDDPAGHEHERDAVERRRGAAASRVRARRRGTASSTAKAPR